MRITTKTLVGLLVASGIIVGLVQPPNDTNLIRADFGLTFFLGVTTLTGLYILKGLTEEDSRSQEMARRRQVQHQQCAFVFNTYDPATGLYQDKTGKKRVCPYLK